MVLIAFYALTSVVIVSLVSLIGIFSLMMRKEKLSKLLLSLVSLSAGSLLGGAFFHLLPEATEKQGFSPFVSLVVIGGIVTFFAIETFIHLRRCETPHLHQYFLVHEQHKHHLGIINLIGDGVHNLIDGLIIAGSYLVSIPVGIATTLAVIFHEVPQELGDFGVLLYAGFSKMKALFLNFLSAAVAIIGTIIGLIMGDASEMFISFILPFAAGGFIYIAGANLIPELHRECKLKDSIWHFSVLLLGVILMFALRFLE